MEPSLKEGDILLVRKFDWFFSRVKDNPETKRTDKDLGTNSYRYSFAPILHCPPIVSPGQVVVFASPATAFPSENHVKRVVGIAGQVVRVRPKDHDRRGE